MSAANSVWAGRQGVRDVLAIVWSHRTMPRSDSGHFSGRLIPSLSSSVNEPITRKATDIPTLKAVIPC
jgi:hypothetical protein